jgi:hypothetical protein
MEKISREALLSDLRTTALRVGKTPRCRDCQYSQSAFTTEFGTFNKALDAAGYGNQRPRDVPREQVIDALQSLRAQHGRVTYEVAREHLKFDLSVVERVFGSWAEAMKAVFGKTNTTRGVSNEELLEHIRATDLKYGKATTHLLKLHRGTLIRRFGSASRAYELAGVPTVAEPGLQRWVFRLLSRELGEPVLREKTFPWLLSPRGFPMRLDGFIVKYDLCVEFDGSQHDGFSERWHHTMDYFKYRQSCDTLKDKLVREHGLRMLRFRWDDKISAGLIRNRLETVGITHNTQELLHEDEDTSG